MRIKFVILYGLRMVRSKYLSFIENYVSSIENHAKKIALLVVRFVACQAAIYVPRFATYRI